MIMPFFWSWVSNFAGLDLDAKLETETVLGLEQVSFDYSPESYCSENIFTKIWESSL